MLDRDCTRLAGVLLAPVLLAKPITSRRRFGPSALLLQVTRHAATRGDPSTGFIPLEMDQRWTLWEFFRATVRQQLVSDVVLQKRRSSLGEQTFNAALSLTACACVGIPAHESARVRIPISQSGKPFGNCTRAPSKSSAKRLVRARSRQPSTVALPSAAAAAVPQSPGRDLAPRRSSRVPLTIDSRMRPRGSVSTSSCSVASARPSSCATHARSARGGIHPCGGGG